MKYVALISTSIATLSIFLSGSRFALLTILLTLAVLTVSNFRKVSKLRFRPNISPYVLISITLAIVAFSTLCYIFIKTDIIYIYFSRFLKLNIDIYDLQSTFENSNRDIILSSVYQFIKNPLLDPILLIENLVI